jgi:hypothetical protein
MRRAAIALAATALLAVPATAGATREIPPPQCDPAACPNPVEIVEERTQGARDCVSGAITAIRYIIQGTPQPQECNPV